MVNLNATPPNIKVVLNPNGYHDQHYVTLLVQSFGNICPIDAFQKNLPGAPYRFVAATQSGKPVAIGCCSEVQYIPVYSTSPVRCLRINYFGTVISEQKKGHGTQLLRAIIQWAQGRGYPGVVLEVHTENDSALGLYERVGFRKHYHAENYYEGLQKASADAFLMYLDFSPAHH